MIRVEFLGPIAKEPLDLDIKTLKELATVMAEDSQLKEWVGICAVAVNDTIVKKSNYELHSGDVVSILPPVCGG
ncbi:MAG TPA: MoaD/ThiS family protein [Nitratifractor sp.]|nr:MoaD/ThiS family protein [Nitratifractor sp.]